MDGLPPEAFQIGLSAGLGSTAARRVRKRPSSGRLEQFRVDDGRPGGEVTAQTSPNTNPLGSLTRDAGKRNLLTRLARVGATAVRQGGLEPRGREGLPRPGRLTREPGSVAGSGRRDRPAPAPVTFHRTAGGELHLRLGRGRPLA
jgi:hypothetical protein